MKKVAVLGIVLVLLFSLAGCQKKPGFEIGFGYNWNGGEGYAVAARSDKTEFDVDDVTIEFYFGWREGIGMPDGNPLMKYLLYFYELSDWNCVQGQLDSYDLSNQIDKAVFVKEIPIEEFTSTA